jgi:hypothetical protein
MRYYPAKKKLSMFSECCSGTIRDKVATSDRVATSGKVTSWTTRGNGIETGTEIEIVIETVSNSTEIEIDLRPNNQRTNQQLCRHHGRRQNQLFFLGVYHCQLQNQLPNLPTNAEE